LPPGLARLTTSPRATVRAAVNTIGIVQLGLATLSASQNS
jgi:hypothetical protein